MTCDAKKPLSSTSAMRDLTSSVRIHCTAAPSWQRTVMDRDPYHGVSLDKNYPIRRKVGRNELPEVIPDVLLCLEADKVLSRSYKGLEHL